MVIGECVQKRLNELPHGVAWVTVAKERMPEEILQAIEAGKKLNHSEGKNIKNEDDHV